MAGRAATLVSIVNHVFLPPRLPRGKDSDAWVLTLEEQLKHALDEFLSLQRDERDAGRVCIAFNGVNVFSHTRDLAESGGISEEELEDKLATLHDLGTFQDRYS